ncbi:MAG: hypothetical protein D6832_05855 [Alphaproteobacteria bacterium]|nr:MAG: hypothetical protein D6832_05855 [Alphaproteobacteria bacterium]
MWAAQPLVARVIFVVLGFELVSGLVTGRWMSAAVAAATMALTIVPLVAVRRFGIRLPPAFLAWTTVFVFASIFLGEAQDFYERFWWWDLVLHGSSAMAIGLFAFLLIFMLFEGDRYAAPPWALGALSFCVAMTIGGLWEIFEFTMDQLFGFNMQKSGLVDTMTDMIVDALGAAVSGLAGFLYLKGRDLGGSRALIEAFIAENRARFRRWRERM